MSEMSFSKLFARVRVVFTSLGKDNLPVCTLTGLETDLRQAEQVHGVPIWGALGILARPPAPDAKGVAANGFAVRVGDVLLPIALQDPRLAKVFGALADGAIALAGYLGQRVTLEPGTGGGAKITIAISGGASPLSIVLDSSPGVGCNVITGRETLVTSVPGGEVAALPVLIAADPSTITMLVANMNALIPVAAAATPPVSLPFITPNIAVSPALKATPT